MCCKYSIGCICGFVFIFNFLVNMLCNFCFDYRIILYSIPIFLCSKYYSVYEAFHLGCDSQISFFIKRWPFSTYQLSFQRNNCWKIKKFRKVPSLASIWHAIQLDSCEMISKLEHFIGTLNAILGLIEPLKAVLAQNQRPTQLIGTTVDGTVSTTLLVLSINWYVAISFNFNKKVR